MIGFVCSLFKFQSVLISPHKFVYAHIFGDVYCRYCSHLGQWSQSNWLFCWFYPPQLCRVCWIYLQTLSWRSRYFVGERPSQLDMMWWMVSFSTRQIRHVSSSSTLKTCCLIYLVGIACSWIAATVDYVDIFRVEDFSHWLDYSLSTWDCSRYLEIVHVYSFFWVPPPVSWCVRIWWWISAAIFSRQPVVEYHVQFHHNIAVPSGG